MQNSGGGQSMECRGLRVNVNETKVMIMQYTSVEEVFGRMQYVRGLWMVISSYVGYCV